MPRFRTSAFYNGVGSFKAAFPTLFDANVEWEELVTSGEAPRNRNRRKMGFRRGNFNRGLIPCGDNACREGGYQVDRLIEEMLTLNESDRSGVLYCSGRRLAEESQRASRCTHRISYRVTLTKRKDKRAA